MITKLRTCVLFLVCMLIASSADLFGQWYQQPFPTSEYLWKVHFVDESTGWVLGHEFLYKTTDGGTTWTQQDSTLGGGYALFALNSNVVFYTDWIGPRWIRRTSDGGATWETVDATPFFYSDFEFIDSLTGFAAGGVQISGSNFHPAVRKTTDGGATWATVWTDSSGQSELEGISFADEMNGWALSYDAYIFHTTDGGDTWVLQDSIQPPGFPPPFFLSSRDIQFTTPDSGWVVGGISGHMLTVRTTDGGDTWVDNVTGGSSLREITMLSSQLGWFAGSVNFEPYVARTTNGGETWETQTMIPPNPQGFESISMVSGTTGWAVGGHGWLYKTSNGGVVSVNEGPREGIPSSFMLEQNYPNPFNPSTVIKYGVPHEAHVNLMLYDVLGREVLTLVDGFISPGFHEVSVDASGLSSGVYYYRLSAGNFIGTKKLTLLK